MKITNYLKIASDLKQEDYQELIEKAKCDVMFHKSHKVCKLYILNHEIASEIICEGIKLSDDGRTIEGKYVPPYMKYAFKFRFLNKDIDLVKNMLDYNDVEVDGQKYYIGDYIFQNETFELKFISYNLFKSEVE